MIHSDSRERRRSSDKNHQETFRARLIALPVLTPSQHTRLFAMRSSKQPGRQARYRRKQHCVSRQAPARCPRSSSYKEALANLLTKRAVDLAELMADEMGKPLKGGAPNWPSVPGISCPAVCQICAKPQRASHLCLERGYGSVHGEWRCAVYLAAEGEEPQGLRSILNSGNQRRQGGEGALAASLGSRRRWLTTWARSSIKSGRRDCCDAHQLTRAVSLGNHPWRPPLEWRG